MPARIIQLLVLICFSSLAFGVDLKPGVTLQDLQRVDGGLIYLELLRDEKAKANLTALMNADIEGGYVKALFSDDPRMIDADYIDENVDIKVEGNQKLELDKTRFSRLYFAVRLKKNDEIIGSSEAYSVADKDIALSVYIAKAHSRKGYASDVLTAELDAFAKTTLAGYAIWECYADNAASIKLALKNGFAKTHGFLDKGRIVHRYVWNFQEKTIMQTLNNQALLLEHGVQTWF